MKKRVKFYTLGCKTNQYETQAIREALVSSGAFTEVGGRDSADMYVVNTCTVTQKADRKSRRAIRHCRKENPDAEIVVTGCLVQLDEDTVKGLPGVSIVVKNSEKHKIKELLANFEPRTPNPEYTPLAINDFHEHTKAFVKVQDGCDNFCSYCKVPLVRGSSRSRRMDDILDEVMRLIKNGFRELVLTGICLGDWGKGLEGNSGLAELVRKIDQIDGAFRLRLSSIEPNMLTDALIDTVTKAKKVCRHLHIPLQSGSDRILNLMNRPYTAKDFVALINRIKKRMPGVSITSDVMIGFPYETESDFKMTVSVIRRIEPSRLHIFTYSERKHTAASRYESNISAGALKRRRESLEALAETLSYRYRRRFLNKRAWSLVETKRDKETGLLTGYTDTYIKFLLDGPDSLMGSLVNLRVAKVEQKANFFEY